MTVRDPPPRPSTAMLIDDFMPRYDAVERHATLVNAAPERVWEAVRTLDLARSPAVRVLFALRSIPGLFAGKTERPRKLGVTLADLLAGGFVLLGERPGDELLLGLAGRFWRPTGGIVRLSPDEYRAGGPPGLALAAWNFTLRPDGGAVRLATETRIRCTDEASRRSFLRYWRLVGPFSALTRIEMLRTLRRGAEHASA